MIHWLIDLDPPLRGELENWITRFNIMASKPPPE